MGNSDWQSVAKRAQDYRDDSIRRVQPPIPAHPEPLLKRVIEIPEQFLSQEEISITQKKAEDLLSLLASGEFTCLQVTKAFLRRAGLAQQLTNCVTELLPERALQRAQYLDEKYHEHGKNPTGPLHGLPISVKEHVGMSGLSLSVGFVSHYDQPPYPLPATDATILQILWRAGCVFYVRTTEPQTVMHLETNSNLYGITVNPYNTELTPGGSSGGEGALLALKGSCLGIGTDIGGSVRSPAANCGLWSLRPTCLRVPAGGIEDCTSGEEQILGTVGPMSTSLDGLRILMKTVIEARPWLVEPSLMNVEWKSANQVCPESYSPQNKLKIGIMWHDGVVYPQPPVQRALRELVDRLISISWIEVVDWVPWAHDDAWTIISSLYFPDGGVRDAAIIDASGEPWLPLSKWILKDNPNVRDLSRDELFALVARRDAYRTEYTRRWNETATNASTADDAKNSGGSNGGVWVSDRTGMVDVILCPVGPGPAPRLGTSKYWSYTSVWNLLDWPALVFPATTVDATKDAAQPAPDPLLSEKDRENWDLWREGGEAEGWNGLPVGLQLVGRRGEDEKVLEIMSRIEKAVGGLPLA